MERKALLQLILASLEDGKLYCERAYEIARENDLKLWQIGKICEEEKIKIKGCQLGCF